MGAPTPRLCTVLRPRIMEWGSLLRPQPRTRTRPGAGPGFAPPRSAGFGLQQRLPLRHPGPGASQELEHLPRSGLASLGLPDECLAALSSPTANQLRTLPSNIQLIASRPQDSGTHTPKRREWASGAHRFPEDPCPVSFRSWLDLFHTPGSCTRNLIPPRLCKTGEILNC